MKSENLTKLIHDLANKLAIIDGKLDRERSVFPDAVGLAKIKIYSSTAVGLIKEIRAELERIKNEKNGN